MRWAGFRKVRGQVCRRIARRVGELGLTSFESYGLYLEGEPREWPILDSLCRVTISRFFRDRGVFGLIRDRLLPELATAAAAGPREDAGAGEGGPGPPEFPDSVVRCWSAGCASGEEPYTLRLIWRLHLQNRFPDIRLMILGTDADEILLGRARTARYPASSLKELAPEWAEAAFEPEGGELRLGRPFRDGVDLVRQDIREKMPEGPFHLVLCRNLVFTYFDTDLQVRLLGGILDRVLPGGFLVVGAHEGLPPGDWPLEQVRPAVPVFRRR
jgi:chemotaxis protein methyltransferase CheR